jgi:glycosyl hydrolase family 26
LAHDQNSHRLPSPGVLLLLTSIGTAMLLPGTAQATQRPPRAYLGAYVQPEDWSRHGQKASINELERDIGKLDIDHYYFKWNDYVFPNWRQRWDHRNGRIPMISWGRIDLDSVLDGSQDAVIRERARRMDALDARVLLRWFYEMDADTYEGHEIESPAQYIDAWRYIHDIFTAEGATKVQWVWCPNAWSFTTGEAELFYPGDDYVDWICADGYNWAPARENARWTSFRTIFAGFYEWAAPKAQPLMVGETGVLENDPGDKATWIRGMGTAVKRAFPDIRALVYFDAHATANFGGWYDFRIDTSSSSYEAFVDLAKSRYFSGRRRSGS